MLIKLKLASTEVEIPKQQTEFSSGMDIRAFIPEKRQITLLPNERVLIPTGLFVELPDGYEIQIRPRSGMALKHGITVLNSPGTIDGDYRGEIGVILHNTSDTTFTINHQDRIAQMVVCEYQKVSFSLVDQLTITERGEGGFGHTGKQ